MLDKIILFIKMFWKMRAWLLPLILLFILWALYESIEDKYSKRVK